MLRVPAGVLLRANANAGKWQQCMKLSTTKIVNSAAAATPEPQINPPILYTGVSFILLLKMKNLFYIMIFSFIYFSAVHQ